LELVQHAAYFLNVASEVCHRTIQTWLRKCALLFLHSGWSGTYLYIIQIYRYIHLHTWHSSMFC